MSSLQKPRGTQDIFLKYSQKFHRVVEVAQKIAKLHNFDVLRTPTFENVELFERNIGQGTDAISKELYRFVDQGERNLALRPEFTAGVVRAYCENKELYTQAVPVRLFSWGQVFRYDRPKKGRFREFHQINFELFSETSDVVTLGIAVNLLENLGVIEKTTLLVNFLGEAKIPYTQAVKDYFLSHFESLSQVSKIRLEKNTLRILDSKEKEDVALLKNAPKISSFYTENDRKNLAQIIDFLKSQKVKFEVEEGLVRGLDYYTGLVFEFVSPLAEDGSNLAILGGGRYDNLISQMGGKPTPAVGFGGGIERISLLLESCSHAKKIFILNATESSLFYLILQLQKQLDGASFQEILCHKNKIGKIIQKLSSVENSYVIVVGEQEIARKSAVLKNLKNRNEEVVNF